MVSREQTTLIWIVTNDIIFNFDSFFKILDVISEILLFLGLYTIVFIT